MVAHTHQGLDQDIAVQQHESAHELSGACPALLPQPLSATHQLLMRHLQNERRVITCDTFGKCQNMILKNKPDSSTPDYHSAAACVPSTYMH